MAANTSNPTTITAGGGGSMSTVFTETENGWHVMNIERYSQTKGVLGVGEPYRSAAFSAGGHRWRVGYYADGYSDDSDDCIGFELILDEDPDDPEAVRARFVFALLDKDGRPVPAYTVASAVVGTFSGAVPSWGVDRFIERTELEAMYLRDDDSFSVRCDVTVYKDSRRENNLIAAVLPPPPPSSSRSCARVCVRLIFWGIVLFACWGMLCNLVIVAMMGSN